MAHECPDCGQLCYCDMEDHEQPAPDDCCHACAEETDEDSIFGPPEDDEDDPTEVEGIDYLNNWT